MYNLDDIKRAYVEGYLEGRNNPLLDTHKKKLSIENVNTLLKAGCKARIIKFLNENHEDPDSLFDTKEIK